MGVAPDSSRPEGCLLVIQAFCDASAFRAICDAAGLDCSGLFKRNALDGDPYTLVLGVTVAGEAIRAVRDVAIALIRARHPLKLSVGDKTVVSGASVKDLPEIDAFLKRLGQNDPDNT